MSKHLIQPLTSFQNRTKPDKTGHFAVVGYDAATDLSNLYFRGSKNASARRHFSDIWSRDTACRLRYDGSLRPIRIPANPRCSILERGPPMMHAFVFLALVPAAGNGEDLFKKMESTVLKAKTLEMYFDISIE